jgi:tRNA(fMet)-specific endonuclease VapC
MILLDTDHLSVLIYRNHSLYAGLANRLLSSPDQFFVASAVSLEEQLRGWLALIHRQKSIQSQVAPYNKLVGLVQFYQGWTLLPFNEAAADRFVDLRRLKVKIGSQDLKIASIALANDVLLLSSNLRDFSQIPNLRVADWLYGHHP